MHNELTRAFSQSGRSLRGSPLYWLSMSLPAFPFTWFRRTTRDTKDEPMIADVETPRAPDPLRWLVLASFCANGFVQSAPLP